LGNLKARFAASSLWFSIFESNGFAAKACAARTGIYSFFKLKIKSTLRAIVLDGF
jgi:hypothetical protein